MINICFPFFACFSKTIDFGSVFSAVMNSACKNTQISTFSEDLQKKTIYPSIFGFFPSKKHDSVGIRHFCLRLLEKITKNRKK